uniref:Uncharacterized protein n=1 Tax=Mycolicibacterium sp. CBMA 213 TaxID=1968788 RepID=A0A1S6GKK8_9MYCO|nr:hypothetical protein pCBMA213_2_00041 [Mycolicibacterium sp. CBMA 213]
MRLILRGAGAAHRGSQPCLVALLATNHQIRAHVRPCALTAAKPIVVQPMSSPAGARSDCYDFATRRPRCAEAPRTGCNTIGNTRTTSNERNAVLAPRMHRPRHQNYAQQPEHHGPRQRPAGSDLATPRSADTQMNTRSQTLAATPAMNAAPTRLPGSSR